MNLIQYNPGNVQGAFIGIINNIGLPENFNNAGFLQLCRVRNHGDIVNNIDQINNLLNWNDPIDHFKIQSFNLNNMGWFIDHFHLNPDQRPPDYDPFIQITTLQFQPQPQDLQCLAVYSNDEQLVENDQAALIRVANNNLQRPMLIDQPANHDVNTILEFMVILVYRLHGNNQRFLHNYRFYWSWNIITGANFQGFQFPFVENLNDNQLGQMTNVLNWDVNNNPI